MNRALKSMIVLKFGTQDDFAARIGMSRSFVSNVVQDRRKLPFQQRIKWAEALGCSVVAIFPMNHEIQTQILGNTLNDSDSSSNQKEAIAYEK